MGLVTDYLKYQEEYQEKYGEKTVVLYQNGSFLECFEFSPDKVESGELPSWPTQKLGHAVDLSSFLGYTLTKRNKSKPYSLSNPNMIGIPCIAYEKHRDLILAKEYTIVLVEQERPGPNAPRRVTKVVSPATEIDDLSPIPVNNQIVSIYIDIQKEGLKFEDYLIAVGVSTIDVTTGDNVVGEIYSKVKDAIYAIQEIYRFLLSNQPRELIVNINGLKPDKTEQYKSWLINNLELNKYPIYVIIINKIDPEYLKSNYHKQFLTKIFYPASKPGLNIVKTVTVTNIIEELELERIHYGTISYILLLQYCYEHNERLVEKIKKPNTNWIDENKHLIIAHNALKQLDVLPPIKSKKSEINSLISVIDNTSTSLGRRLLYDMVTNPITNISDLTNYYDMIDDFIKDNTLMAGVEDILKKLPDLDRYQRKMQLKLIKPNEFVTLFRGYINIVKLYTILLNSDTKLKHLLFTQVNDFNKCLTVVLTRYNLESLNLAIIDNDEIISSEPIFYPGKDETADKFYRSMEEYQVKINMIVEHLNSNLSSTRGKLIEYNNSKQSKKDEYRSLALFTTTHKGTVLSKAMREGLVDTELCGNIQITSVNKEVMITSDVIGSLLQNLINVRNQYNQYLFRCYTKTVNEISNNYDFFGDINVFISKLDYTKSNAKTAIKNKYFRPTILDENTDVSCLDIKDLRHPISEKLIDSVYVTNDLVLGHKPYGMLLYGSNSVGKSTLTKAVGLNLIMAQSGMFTACILKYIPYNKIITRLSGEDNLIKGESSFVVEMSELRTILRNSDSRTLVLGDELCRGTESASGTGISINTILWLINRKSSFIFSTHMHHLASNNRIVDLGNMIRISHLALKCDPTNNTLIYERKLEDGPGESIYGLEVAMSLSIDMDFIREATEIRREYLNEGKQILSTRKSKHNSKVYVDSCWMCGKKPNTIGDLATHHNQEQSLADSNGFIDYYHKNSSFNLTILCDSCHKNLHSNGLKVVTQETVSGKIVSIE